MCVCTFVVRTSLFRVLRSLSWYRLAFHLLYAQKEMIRFCPGYFDKQDRRLGVHIHHANGGTARRDFIAVALRATLCISISENQILAFNFALNSFEGWRFRETGRKTKRSIRLVDGWIKILSNFYKFLIEIYSRIDDRYKIFIRDIEVKKNWKRNFIVQWTVQAFICIFYEKLFKSLKTRCFTSAKYLTKITNWSFWPW